MDRFAFGAPEAVVTDGVPESRPPPSRRRVPGLTGAWTGLGTVLAGTALIAVHASLYGRWLVDDAGITFAYARNISEGSGPVLQQGAPAVEGYSDPLWLLVLITGRLAGLFDRGELLGLPDYVVFTKGIALLCCAGLLAAVHWASGRLTRLRWAVTLGTAAGLAILPSFVIWSFSGLENALYAMLVVILAAIMFRAVLSGWLISNRAAVLTATFALLAALTRPDGAIYAAAYPLVVLAMASRTSLPAAVRKAALSSFTFLVPYVAFSLWRLAVFGRLTPNTAAAKAQTVPGWEDFERAIEPVQAVGWVLILAVVGCVSIVLVTPSRTRTAMVPLLITLGLAITAFCCLPTDWMEQYRFATPIWAVGAWVAVLATGHVVARSSVRRRAIVVTGLGLGLLLTSQVVIRDVHAFRAEPTVPLCMVADRYGRTINGYADLLHVQGGSLLAPDLGGTALTSRLTAIDLTGLADKRIADYYAASDMRGMRDYVFNEVKPTFIHSHENWNLKTDINNDPRIFRDYTEIYSDPSKPAADWVRKDHVGNPAELAQARNYAHVAIRDLEVAADNAPQRSCGATLRVGQRLPGNG